MISDTNDHIMDEGYQDISGSSGSPYQESSSSENKITDFPFLNSSNPGVLIDLIQKKCIVTFIDAIHI